MAKKQLPIKDMLRAIDKKDRAWYNNLSAEEQKSFNAWLLMRYVSTVQGKSEKHYLYFTNLLVNQNFSDSSKHPELMWLLLTAAGSGRVETHNYIKPPTSRKKRDRVSVFLLSVYPHLKHDEIALIQELNTTDDLRQLAKNHGFDDEKIREIFGK
jgi:hypothetical protein